MKRILIAILLLGLAGSAWAQAAPATQGAPANTTYDSAKFYLSALGGVTLGNRTSSMFGAEAGYKFGDALFIIAEGGRMTDLTTSGTESAAATLGGFITGLGKGTATWTVTTPAAYFAGGIRYIFPMSGKLEPYVAATIGVAKVETKTSYLINGADITGALPSYGVQLGQDLSGTVNKALITFGGGVTMPLGAVVVDIGGRYGRIFTDPGTNYLRLHAGVGIRF